MDKRIQHSLVLNIAESGKVTERVLRNKDKLTIGQRADNDVTLLGKEYPKSHVLFTRSEGRYKIFLPRFIKDGEIRLQGTDSSFNLKDLILHDILPRSNGYYVLNLSPDKKGYLTVGDTRIDFLFETRQIVKSVLPKYEGFSWLNVTLKTAGSDLLFKTIFTLLLIFNLIVLYLFKDYEIKVQEQIDVQKVQERFAKFILKTPDEILQETMADVTTSVTTTESEAEAGKKEQGAKSTRPQSGGNRRSGSGGNPAASSGLLSLIGGTGSGSKSSSVVDALVDRGLVADLKNILGSGTNLKVGNGNTKDDIDPLDQLIGTGGSGGIDDFLASMDDNIEEVTLTKQATVNLSHATSRSGSQEALGYRSEQSVMSVVNMRMGRITWLYEKYLKLQTNLAGKVTVEFTIAANGFVTSVSILESTINHPQLERDIMDLIKRLKFDPIPSGSATFVFPFHFKKIQ
ncbi:energy transducer TonB [candidate division KSB1 bacterium]|nr:energy transducer TonB [candidate division KSB1 bacterium]